MRFAAIFIIFLFLIGCTSYEISPQIKSITNPMVRKAFEACAIDAQVNGTNEQQCRADVVRGLLSFARQVLENKKCVRQYQAKAGL